MELDEARDHGARRRALPAGTLLTVGLVAFLAGLAAMAFAYSWWTKRNASPVVKAPVVSQPASVPVVVPDKTALNELTLREAALSDRINDLEQRLSGIDSDSRTASGFATRAEGLMVAFAARRALDRGLPLGYIEGQLRERFGTAQPRAVAIVRRAARDPVTLEDLRLALDTIAPKLLNGGTDSGWWNSIHRELSNLVVLRKEQTPSPRPSDRLQRARRMLDAGQVEGALAEVAHMPGADEAGSWITAAKRYIEARRALNAIETTALEGGGVPAQPAPSQPQSQPAATPSPASETDNQG